MFQVTKDFTTVLDATKKINETLASVFTPQTTVAGPRPHHQSTKYQYDWEIDITTTLVEEHLRKLNRNKAMGSDMIPTILYKEAAAWLAPPLAHLFNLSLQER